MAAPAAMNFVVPGPCQVLWGPDQTTIPATGDLGYTKSGAQVQLNQQVIPVTEDRGGDQPVDFIVSGKQVIVSAVFIDVAKLKTVIGAALVRLFELGNATGTKIQVGNVVSLGPLGAADTTQLGKVLTIKDRWGEYLHAKLAYPTPQSVVRLASTQETQFQLDFYVAPDDAGKFFSTVPSYLTPS